MLVFKKHIRELFSDTRELAKVQYICSSVFEYDKNAEIRIHINGKMYFLNVTDMETE